MTGFVAWLLEHDFIEAEAELDILSTKAVVKLADAFARDIALTYSLPTGADGLPDWLVPEGAQ